LYALNFSPFAQIVGCPENFRAIDLGCIHFGDGTMSRAAVVAYCKRQSSTIYSAKTSTEFIEFQKQMLALGDVRTYEN